jgi:ATP-dependent RNA circularization protein (DNA/RNA ligase family)
MWQSIYDRYNEREIAAYREGQEEALRFRANHGDIHQDLFKAETDSHKVYVGYDDVEFGVFLEITFKQRFDKDGNIKKVMVSRGRFDTALARALDFLARHPYERPYCNVDY